jgi:hypothetical protein
MARTLVIVIAFVLAGGLYLYNWQATQQAQAEVDAAIVDARRTFADKAASIVGQDEDEYLRRIKEALTAYERELDDIFADHPDWRNPNAYEEAVQRQLEEGQITEAQSTSMLEGYELVRSAYDTLLQGTWKPTLTAVGNGDIRMDLYDFRRTEDLDGNPLLEAKAFFWGVESNTRVSWGNLSLRYWHTTKPDRKEKRQLRRKGLPTDEIEKVLGKAEGPADPYIFLQSPENYVNTFPSFVSVGRVRWPAMPSQAHAVDIEYGFTARTGGGSHEVSYTWDELPIPPDWQLREGEVWNADVVEATEEEIAGREPGEGP